MTHSLGQDRLKALHYVSLGLGLVTVQPHLQSKGEPSTSDSPFRGKDSLSIPFIPLAVKYEKEKKEESK